MEEVNEPKYILSKPKAPDIFTMADIIGKIGVNKFASCLQNEEIQKLVKGISKKKSVSNEDISMIAGIGVFTEIAQIILDNTKLTPGHITSILVVLGAFLAVVTKTGALETGIKVLIKKLKGREHLLIPILMFIFSIGGTTYGMLEETVGFYVLLAATMMAAG